MQFSGNFRPPTGVLYDADFGRGAGQALALCLLYGLDGKNECRVVSISVTKPVLASAGAAEIFSRFYAGAVSGAFGAVGRNLPTGMITGAGDPTETPILKAILQKKNAEGKPAYEHGLKTVNDTAEPAALLRNALTAQHDQNCVVVLNGPAANLAQLLALSGAKAWIERKAKFLVIAGGAGFSSDLAAARKVLDEWPGPIVFVNADAAVPYPGASIETDFAWAPSHPLVDAYRAAGTMPYDTTSTEMAAVLYAVRGEKEKLYAVSDAGGLTLSDDGSAKLTAGAGKHQVLLPPTAEQRERIVKTVVELVSAKPVPRVPRFRSQQQQPADPAKKAAEPVKK
jgi:hypothetical protein